MSLKSANKTEPNVYELELEIDGAEFEEAIKQTYLKKKNRMKVSGFRDGKAPRHIIENFYGESVFYEDALDSIFPKVLEAAVSEAGLETVAPAHDVDVVSIGKDGVSIKLKVTVKPEVELGEYKGLAAVRKSAGVTDEEIDGEIGRLRDRNSRIITVEGRAAEDGDMVVIDFEGFVDGEAFEGGKAENYSLTLGSHQFIPGFEEQIAGKNAGDEFEVSVTFPEEYQAEELAGKPAVFKVKLHEIKTKELPEADDDFAKDVSEFDTIAELRDDCKAKIAEGKKKESDNDFENQLITKLIGGLKADIPEAMFDSQTDELVKDFSYRLQNQGMSLQKYLEYTGMDPEGFRKTFREQAERQVKIRLALEKVVKLEALEASDDDLEKEYQKYADMYKMDIEKIRATLPADGLREEIAMQKAVDLIVSSASETEEEPVKEEKKPAKKTVKKPEAKKAEPETDSE